MNFYKIDRMHLVLFISVLLSVALNALFYISYQDLEKDAEEINTLYAGVEEEIGNVRRCNENVKLVADIKNNGKKEDIAIFTIQSGDTLSKIFSEAGISPSNIMKIAEAINKVFKVSKLRIGNKVEITEAESDENAQGFYPPVIKVRLTSGNQEIIVKHDNYTKRYIAVLNQLPVIVKHVFYSHNIEENLYTSANNAGVNSNTIMQFINIFSHSLDFQRDVRPGDQFEILYEYHEDLKGRDIFDGGKILYASLTAQGKKNALYRFDVNDRRVDYINDDATSIKKTLLQTPISGARISSRFGMRKHPILGFSRMHRGLDYAAPTGTPVFAAGDGVIDYVRQNKSYGKYVKIKHNAKYSTLYAHLNGFATNAMQGKRVRQGDIIGYVGSTGLASGPHLHYEVHEYSRRVNPAAVKFDKEKPLLGNNLSKFVKNKHKIHDIIEKIKLPTQLAIKQNV